MKIEHISVSRGKSYNQCPYYYKLKYHEKIPNPEEEKFYFVYGKIIHKIAEVMVDEKGKRPVNLVCEDILKGKIEIEQGVKAPPLPLEYKKRFPINIKNLIKLGESIGYNGITEYKFKYDLDPPNKKNVVGFIDRLILDKEKAWIIDYKTTKKGPFRETKQTIKYDPQLRTYCRIVQKEFGLKASNIKAALYYLEDGLVLSASYSEKDLDSIEQELLDLYNKIEKHDSNEAIGKTGKHCNLCEYKGMCPFFKKKNTCLKWNGDLKNI